MEIENREKTVAAEEGSRQWEMVRRDRRSVSEVQSRAQTRQRTRAGEHVDSLFEIGPFHFSGSSEEPEIEVVEMRVSSIPSLRKSIRPEENHPPPYTTLQKLQEYQQLTSNE